VRGKLERRATPCCGYECDAASDLEALARGGGIELEQPADGDFTLCLNCGALLIFADGEGNRMRWPTRLERASLSSKQRRLLVLAQKYVRGRGMIKEEAGRLRRN
jgi:hypothetical protein